MGKKSRLKRERKEKKKEENYQEPFLVKIIRFGVYIALFAPLVVWNKAYFPFVGAKSLFFMGLAEIIFFSWLLLIINYKKYRPKKNALLIAFGLFLIVLTLSSIFGVDFSRSFWSKFERMAGLLMWLHLFGFFLAVSSTFKKKKEWKRIFAVSVLVASIAAIIAFLEVEGGLKTGFVSKQGGTLGNSTFLGSYLLFNAFLALWLFSQFKNWGWKIYSLIGFLIIAPVIHIAGARAATISLIGGLVLLILLWLCFKPKSSLLKTASKIVLAIALLVGITAVVLLFVEGSFVQKLFIEKVNLARVINWNIALEAFQEKPLLGWGPENYTVAFPHYFNPCLFVRECGTEIWFDRSHNIVTDTLSMTGILGLLTYLALFISFFYLLIRKYLKEKEINFWTFAVFSVIPLAYFVQNLTVFDMIGSLMMFVLVLAFVGSLSNKKENREVISKERAFFKTTIVLVFLFSIFAFVIQPLKTDHYVIRALGARNTGERIGYYEKALNSSPVGRYQIREFFARESKNKVKNNEGNISAEDAQKELDYAISILEKTKRQSPLEYRSMLQMSRIYNYYVLFDSSKLPTAYDYAQKLLELSPGNQQSYWELSQVLLYKGEFDKAIEYVEKAIEAEPRYLSSYGIAAQAAKACGKDEKAEEILREGLEMSLERIAKYPNRLINYTQGINLAKTLNDLEKAREIAKTALEKNEEWRNSLENLLGEEINL